MNIFFLILFLLISACSSPKLESSRSNEFFVEWSNDFHFDNKPFQDLYKTYLNSVEELFLTQEKMPKFEAYLSSTTNFFQLMAHAEFNLPTLYRRIKGSRADLRTKMYTDFRNRNLSQQFEKLNRERENKLKEDLGHELFEKLNAHYHMHGQSTQSYPRFPM